MSEIKPVIIKTAQERFQAYMKAKGIPISSSLVHINKMSRFEEQERKEIRAALEALQAENAELKEINDSLHSSSKFTYENQKRDLAELKAENAAQSKRIAHQQYLIDRLMMEYCPDEMTEEQWENWKAHQRRVTL